MPLELPNRSHFDLAVDSHRALIALDRASAEDRERIVRLVCHAGFRLENGLEHGHSGGAGEPAVVRFHQDVRVEVDGMELEREDFVLHQELRLKSSAVGKRGKQRPLVAHSNRLAWIVGDHAVARARELLACARFSSRVSVAPVYYLPGNDRSLAKRYSADPWFVDVRAKRESPNVELPKQLERFLSLRRDLPGPDGWVRAELTHAMDLYEFAKVFLEAAGEHLKLCIRGLPMVVPLAGLASGEPLYTTQKPNLDLMHADDMWNIAQTSATSPVMVFYIDSGVLAPGGADILVDQMNSVFIDQPILGGYQHGCMPSGGNCHGTQMVGITGAQWDRQGMAGLTGVRSNFTHVSLRCASIGQVADALAYAATVVPNGTKGVVVIGLDVLQLYADASNCMALLADMTRFEAAMHTAQTNSDLVIVMPSGNYDPTASTPLWAIPRVPPDVTASLIVGACDRTGTHRLSDPTTAVASRYGTGLSLVAPGENVVTAFDTLTPPGSWAPVTGTSYAAAHVAGVAAVCRASFPTLHANEVKNKLMSCVTALTTSTPGSPPTWDPEVGMGLINGSLAVVP